jgi:hypothetical protein
VVTQTLSPICQRITASITDRITLLREEQSKLAPSQEIGLEQQVEEASSGFDDRVLQLRVLDPAMGSGHFLVRACQYLAEEIATNPYTSDSAVEHLSEEHSILVFWRRRIAEHCLYGVDVNPLAVELAKLALWLETVSTENPLTFLDHRLRVGNSLVGAAISDLAGLPGAPPVLLESLREHFEQSRSHLLEPLDELSRIESTDSESIKKKERLLALYEERSRGFKAVADIWVGEFFRSGREPASSESYAQLIQTLPRPRKMNALLQEGWQAALRAARAASTPFHWELAFPEAFFSKRGQRSDAGFDAVVGNPPYDVLSSLELGYDIEPLKAFLVTRAEYQASFRGKNNLYKLFICKVVSLLADEGRLSFIVPMALLGDDQAVGIRHLLFAEGTLNEVHSFPQKDDSRNRVFPEAKLSTAVFAMTKSSDPEARRSRFRSQRHPGRLILESSPTLSLAAEEITKYDPNNATIVSCDQKDWDLLARMMKGERFVRLGTVCTSYQGEVNETTDKRRGFVSDDPADGPEILRGAHLCMYCLRDASQGTTRFLKTSAFLGASQPGAKAWHSQHDRIGFQRSSPQNNFRRIIAARIPGKNFCFDTISYIPLGQSKILDWYFRLGSTNSKVNEYQFNNLPCPNFDTSPSRGTNSLPMLEALLDAEDWEGAWEWLIHANLMTPPFPSATARVLGLLSDRVAEVESRRRVTLRSERAYLDPTSQPLQDLIDRILFAVAGFTPSEAAGVEERMKVLL